MLTGYGPGVDSSPEHRCWTCGAEPHTFRFECAECTRRWEETECRELRARLFGLGGSPELRVA